MAGRMGRTQIILLTTTGRKSGQTRTLPLGLFDWPGGYLVVASNGGQPRHPAWYLNLMNNPHATVQVFDQVLPVTAEARAGLAAGHHHCPIVCRLREEDHARHSSGVVTPNRLKR